MLLRAAHHAAESSIGQLQALVPPNYPNVISVRCAADQDKPGLRTILRAAGWSRLADDLSGMCWQWPTVVALDGTAVVDEIGHRASRVTSLTSPVGRASASVLAAGPSATSAAVAAVLGLRDDVSWSGEGLGVVRAGG